MAEGVRCRKRECEREKLSEVRDAEREREGARQEKGRGKAREGS